jgi:hypothetical protein
MTEGRPSLFRRRSTWVALVLVGLLGGLALGVGVGWRAAMERSLVSRRCADLPEVDLSVDAIVALKERWRRYTHSDDPDAHLVLSPREASFLLRGESDVGVFLEGAGADLHAELTVPVEEGCYNVDFTGTLEIRRGLAVFDISRLEVGGQDLSGLTGLGGALGSPRQALGPDDVEDPDIRAALANIEDLFIRDGAIHVRFVDPSAVW